VIVKFFANLVLFYEMAIMGKAVFLKTKFYAARPAFFCREGVMWKWPGFVSRLASISKKALLGQM